MAIIQDRTDLSASRLHDDLRPANRSGGERGRSKSPPPRGAPPLPSPLRPAAEEARVGPSHAAARVLAHVAELSAISDEAPIYV